MRLPVSSAVALLVLAPLAFAYDADLLPARNRPEARELTGHLSITGADAAVRVNVAGVLDAAGDPLDDRFVTLELRLRVNGVRRRLVLELPMSSGEGAAETSLGLAPGDRVVVANVRLRGPARKLLAEAGVVTAAPMTGPPTQPDECPGALDECLDDLVVCTENLDACESDA